jgi:uncharacterized membrane protein
MTDDRMDHIIGNLLRAGVMLAAAIVLAGGLWYLASNGMGAPTYGAFHTHPHGPRTPAETLMLAGLIILIATPIARVIFSLVAFGINRDRVFVAITALVLAVLLYSIAAAWL